MASGDAHRLEARASIRERMNARSLPLAKLAIVRTRDRWPLRSPQKRTRSVSRSCSRDQQQVDVEGNVPTAPSALSNPRPRRERVIAPVALPSPRAAARREPRALQPRDVCRLLLFAR